MYQITRLEDGVKVTIFPLGCQILNLLTLTIGQISKALVPRPSCRQFESGYPYSPWHPREDADNPIIANMDNYSVRENRVVLIRTIINTIMYSFTKQLSNQLNNQLNNF